MYSEMLIALMNFFCCFYSINDNAIKTAKEVSIYRNFDSVFVAPIFEEIVFRQILFGCLYDLYSGCNKYIRFITATIVSSIVFGSIHNGVFHSYMLYYVTSGIILSGLYIYTKRLSSPIIVHILHNLF